MLLTYETYVSGTFTSSTTYISYLCTMYDLKFSLYERAGTASPYGSVTCMKYRNDKQELFIFKFTSQSNDIDQVALPAT